VTWDWEKQVTSLIAEVDQLKAELAARGRELEGVRQALLALTAGYQRDQLPAAIWQEVDVALSAGKGTEMNATEAFRREMVDETVKPRAGMEAARKVLDLRTGDKC
jgi:hypothetical protein